MGSTMNNWATRKLEELVSFSSGGTPSKTISHYWKGNIPWISASTMHKQDINTSDLFISHQGLKSGSKLAKAGTLLLLVRGSMLWRRIPICICKRDVAFNQDVKAIRPHKCVIPEFLLYWFLAHEKYLLSKVVGTGIGAGKLDYNEIKSLKIRLPSTKNQREIVDFIRQWDKAIEKTEALIAAKEQQFDWLVARLINDRKQQLEKLKNHFKKSISIEKGKPLVKANIADEGSIPVIAGGKTSPYSHNKYTHSIPCITVSASGAYAGYIWYHDYPIWASDCNVIYSNNHSMHYLYFAIKSKQSQIYALQSGGGQPHIYASDLEGIAIPLPPLLEQKSIAATLNTAQQEINLLKKLAEQYRAQKRGLMQKLLSGEWKINLNQK